MATIHLLIKGKVQGVFYRASAKEKAERLNITGWIRNTEEGNVEMVASGTIETLQQFVAWCKQGPRSASVTTIETKELEHKDFVRFTIVRD